MRVTRAQLQRFHDGDPRPRLASSIANSAGLFGDAPTGCHWVRPGLALYGASPFEDRTAAQLGL